MAKVCNLSPSYFRHLFKLYTGKTFTEKLTEIRINNAIELLTHTYKSITEICLECGFNSINHFYKTFRKELGISPSKFRDVKNS